MDFCVWRQEWTFSADGALFDKRQRLSQNFSFGKATLKFAVLQGFKPEKPRSLSQNRAR
jgi:hypothetical protein